MMKTSHTLTLAAAMLLTATTLGGCREELCYDHTRRSAVALDYEREWERDYGMAHTQAWDEARWHGSYDSHRPATPEGVSMTVYNADGSTTPYFLEPAGGDISLEAGKHDILFYNNDTEYIVINDAASLPDASASTTSRSRASLVAMHSGERTVSPPDVLYGAYADSVPEASLHAVTPMAVTMRPLVYTYVIRYEVTYGLDQVRLARGALAGMAEKVYLKDGHTGTESATVLFDCEPVADGDDAIIARVKSFGVPAFPGEHYGRTDAAVDPSQRFTLNLEVLLPSGTIATYEADVTDQMRLQPRGGVLTMTDLYIIDEADQEESGFDVDIDDWGEWTDVDLPDVDPGRPDGTPAATKGTSAPAAAKTNQGKQKQIK